MINCRFCLHINTHLIVFSVQFSILRLKFVQELLRIQRCLLFTGLTISLGLLFWVFFSSFSRKKRAINSESMIFKEFSHISNWINVAIYFWLTFPEFLQPQHIWPYIQQNFMHHHSQVHYQGFHVSSSSQFGVVLCCKNETLSSALITPHIESYIYILYIQNKEISWQFANDFCV